MDRSDPTPWREIEIQNVLNITRVDDLPITVANSITFPSLDLVFAQNVSRENPPRSSKLTIQKDVGSEGFHFELFPDHYLSVSCQHAKFLYKPSMAFHFSLEDIKVKSLKAARSIGKKRLVSF